MSPAEILKEVVIKPIEMDCLNRVFKFLSKTPLNRLISLTAKNDKNEPNWDKRRISPLDVARVLQFLGLHPSRNNVEQIIWEVDDDLDGYVNYDEFLTMYKRCIVSEKLCREHGLHPEHEPKKLFNLTQFLMYDKTFKGKVTVEETLQILFVRHGRDKLDEEIKHIFGDNEKNEDGSDLEINYETYLEKIQNRALEDHLRAVEKLKKGDIKPPEAYE